MNNKNILIILIAIAVAGGIYWYSMQNKSLNTISDTTLNQNEGSRIDPNSTGSSTPEGKLKVANFSGKLETVDTGCFADGECFVVVDGKHITTTMGWSRDIVGSIQGVPSFGDLSTHIGEEVEVYAQDKGDGTYTLYGSEGFYVKLK